MIIIILIIIAILVSTVLIGAFTRVKTSRKKRLEDTIVLSVNVPKSTVRKDDEQQNQQGRDFKEEMAPAEQFIASLYSVFNDSFFNHIMEDQEVIGLEIVAESNLISFYVTCSRTIAPLVEKQINSFYPNASIEQVKGHNIFSSGTGDYSTATVTLNKRFIFPIRTFRNLEADPLNGITNSMSKMGPGSGAAVQILIKPISDKWRFYATSAAKQVLDGKSHYFHTSVGQRITHSAMDTLTTGMSGAMAKNNQQDQSNQKPFRQTPVQEDLMKAFNEKSSKSGFKTQIRIVTVAPDAMSAQVMRDSICASFAQFNAPAWNGLHILKNGDKRRIVTDFALRNFANAPEMILNSEEIATIFHFPNRYIETPNIRWLKSRSLPAPPNVPTEGTIIGESVYRGVVTPIRIKENDRRRHIFMIGKTGVGKTTLFENMIDQDIAQGKGVCFIDPLGDAIESILKKIPKERAEDVILFDPGDIDHPMGLNLLEWHSPEEKDFLIAEWLEIFYKLFDPNRTGIVGPQFEHWGRNAALTVMSMPGGGTLIDIPRLFTDDAFRDRAVACVKDPVVKSFWEQQLAKTADFHKSEMYNYFISKFGRFMTNDLMRNIIGQKKSAFDLREVMDNGKILLINLAKGKTGDMNSSLLGLILVSKIQTAAFSRAKIPEDQRRDFYLYVDEFQNFTTDSFATILSEARKYRLSLNITNQYIAQLSEKIRDAVIGNAGSMIVYRVGAADAEFMAKEFPGVTIDDMVNLEAFHTYIKVLIDLTPSKPFSLRGVLSPVQKNNELGEAIRQLSIMKYTKTRQELEAEFIAQYKATSTPPAGINEPLRQL